MTPRRQRGFTLLELVVAFVVLALVLSTAFQIFSQGLSRTGDLEEYSQALVVAQARLALTGVEEVLAEGETQGDTTDRKYHWNVKVQRHEEVAAGQSAAPPANYSMYRVDVRVNWRSGDGRDRDVVLTTLTLGPRT